MGSIFHYRVPSLAAESFTEFWKLSFATLSVPETWPKGIAHALRSVGLLQKEEIKPAASALAPAFDIALAPHTPVSIPTAMTNREGVSRIPSPPKPRKVYGNFPIVPSSPGSPTVRRQRRSASSSSAATPRTPLSVIQLCESPPKRRRLNSEGKENDALSDSPLVSVAERIAEIFKSNENLKKRKLDPEEEWNAAGISSKDFTITPMKKLKGRMKPKMTKSNMVSKTSSPSLSTSSACSNESEMERRWVADTLTPSVVPFPSVEVERPGYAVDVPRRKREYGMFGSWSKRPTSDVPQQKRDHANSLDNQEVPVRKIDFTKIRRLIRRTISTPETMLNSMSIGKRKRLESDVDNDGDLFELEKRPPIPGLKRQRSNIAPARRTRSLPEPQEKLDSDITVVHSSDDEPRIGQAALRCGLLSDAQKKTTLPNGKKLATSDTLEEDYASDDSFSSDTAVNSSASSSSSSEEDSPTKDVVSRKMQKLGSRSRFFSMVLSQ